MKLENIIKLIDAGYTKADIDAMTEQPAEAAGPAPVEEKSEAAPETAPSTSNNDKVLSDILTEFQALKAAVQRSNIQATFSPTAPDEHKPSDILGTLINPTKK